MWDGWNFRGCIGPFKFQSGSIILQIDPSHGPIWPLQLGQFSPQNGCQKQPHFNGAELTLSQLQTGLTRFGPFFRAKSTLHFTVHKRNDVKFDFLFLNTKFCWIVATLTYLNWISKLDYLKQSSLRSSWDFRKRGRRENVTASETLNQRRRKTGEKFFKVFKLTNWVNRAEFHTTDLTKTCSTGE